MNISSKGYYALISIIYMKCYQKNNEKISVNFLAKKLNISKVYLEQIFSILKKNKVITSIKGAKGGYKINNYKLLSLYDILKLTEGSLIIGENKYNEYPILTQIIKNKLNIINNSIIMLLKEVTIDNMLEEYLVINDENQIMYYI